jgi:DNA-binding CsgD family transcriptional regulator
MMNMTKVAPIEKCRSCACADCATSEIGKIYSLNSALNNAYSILGVGLVFFDEKRNVTHVNDLAKNKLRLPDEFIFLGKDLIRECFDKKSQVDLEAAMRFLSKNDSSLELKLNIISTEEPQLIMLQRLEKTAFGINAPGIVMFIFESKRDIESHFADISRIFGLTKTEARLTLSIVNGMTAAEYAEKHGISINTAYCQIKEILAKTGTRRQAELVKLVLEHAPGYQRKIHKVTLVPHDGCYAH